MKELILMAHVFFGVACLVAAVWIIVDVLHASATNQARIRRMSWAAAGVMWLAFLIGGHWYVFFYNADKNIILKGPWPFAHNYFMETKEHFVITLLLLATYLPIAASNNLAANKEARRLVLCVAALVAVLAVMAEGHGAIISMGVKVALLAKLN
jgi:predicted membrane channel-forming protein YqfA (hemolysin III family)